MTPKQKAKELVDKYYVFNHIGNRHAVKCALIAVETAMEALRFLPYGLDYLQQIDYWEEVKQEIEKL